LNAVIFQMWLEHLISLSFVTRSFYLEHRSFQLNRTASVLVIRFDNKNWAI
jgi:hypothetical protein